MIESRAFNSLEVLSDGRLKKSSSVALSGEIHWYSHVPGPVQDLFPRMHAHDPEHARWYVMDNESKMRPVSDLLVRSRLTPPVLLHVLAQLDRIHGCEATGDDVDIYANYVPKLEKRYAEYDYGAFPESERIFDSLCAALRRYQAQGMGVRSVVHGDPVLTNALLGPEGELKFIDMRGQLGDRLTIVGDRNYDYAKIHQSLLGYDHVLAGSAIPEGYLSRLEERFFRHIGSEHRRWIPTLTLSLLFSLIPLHDDEKCQGYYALLLRRWRQTLAGIPA